NPILLIGDDKSQVVLDLTITSSTEPGTSTYTFLVTDEANLTDQVTVDITIENIPASFGFDPNGTGLKMDSQIEPTNLVKISFIGNRGTAALRTLSVFEDNVLLTADRVVEFNNLPVDANPIPLTGIDSLNTDLFIRPHSEGTKAYRFEIEDENGETISVGFNLNVATSIQTEKIVLLLNAGGPDSTGAVNFLSGLSLNSDDSTAHLIDLGIDLAQPDATNWRKMIMAGQDAVLKAAGTQQPEGFNFASVTTKDQIIAAFNAGVEVNTTGVVEGELYLLEKNDIYFLIEIKSINEISENNDDFYELNLKY
ncbi:MAG: hypothetical protein AAGK97_11410, partial [Bacteroidota bacterium]